MMVYDDFSLQAIFEMDPELIQAVPLDEVESLSKSPIYDRVLAKGGGEGVLLAEGDRSRGNAAGLPRGRVSSSR